MNKIVLFAAACDGCGPDGGHSMLCPACAPLEICAHTAHDWAVLEYEHDGAVQQYGHVCRVCSTVREWDEPPAGHPDSMTVELDHADEAWLAELDELLWPQEAST